jgi:hypothetical protein
MTRSTKISKSVFIEKRGFLRSLWRRVSGDGKGLLLIEGVGVVKSQLL